jgi:hypothetical protein
MNICDRCQQEITGEIAIVKDGYMYCHECLEELLEENIYKFARIFDAETVEIPYEPYDAYKDIGMRQEDF